MDTLSHVGQIILYFVEQYGPTLLYCAFFALVGWILAKCLCKLAKRALQRSSHIGERGVRVATGVIRGLIYTVVVLIVLQAFAVPVTAIVALFSAVGLALSLAVKDTLSNFAKGFQLMVTHPFKIGDFIEVDDISGTVKTIEIVYTRLLTPDNKTILIPNSQISDATIINYSAEQNRRLEMVFPIDHLENRERAESIIYQILKSHPLALSDPKPSIRMGEQTADSLPLIVWVWVKSEHFSELERTAKEQIQDAFRREKVRIPYPHMDVNILNAPGSVRQP